MKSPLNRLLLALALVLPMLQACQTQMVPDKPLVLSEIDRARLELLRVTYPDKCRVIQHMKFKVVNREYDFTLYTALFNKDCRIVGMDGFGNKLFDVQIRNGKQKIVSRLESMPASILTKSVIPDIRHLLLRPRENKGSWGSHEKGLVYRPSKKKSVSFFYNEKGLLARSQERKKKSVKLVAEYQDYKVLDGRKQAVPVMVKFSNSGGWVDTEVELRTLEIKPGLKTDNIFEGK